ncbi:MAG: TatD family deoxyribonuclease [Clostridiales bacterium]|nr:TatD family deoxyribonuclease [Clostridiales bacterium]
MLFDAHTHLDFEKYTDEERRELAAEIEASDVSFIIDVADCVASAKQALADAAAYPWCYAAVGIHPDHASTYTNADIEEIRKLAADPKAVAIGEIGLDFYYGTDDREEQQELFRKQIRLANELRMPIMIHSRDAHQLTMDILKEEGAFSDERKSWFSPRLVDGRELPDARVQMHCFSGSPELALEYARLGATMSLGGPVTFKNGKKAAEVVRKLPIEYLMSETDAPYMAPEPLRGRPNKSPYIEHIVRRMAILKGLDYEETARILTENGKRFFGIS